MKCPFCRETNTEVRNSRGTKSDSQIWRRRRCSTCKKDFTTYEAYDLGFITVTKRDGKPEGYSRAKLHSSIFNSISQLPAPQSTLNAITETIESKILDQKQLVVSSGDIARIVLETLKNFNTTAFLRYLSQQPELTSNSQLKKELKKY